jgi:hypothetical protein
MSDAQQRVACSQVWEDAVYGVCDEDNVELESLRLMQSRECEAVARDPPVAEERLGLELFGINEIAIVEQRPGRVAILPAT